MAIHKLFSKMIQTYHTTCGSFSCQFMCFSVKVPPFLTVYAPSFDYGIPFNNDLLYLTGSNICASASAVVFSHYRYCSFYFWSSKERVSILSCRSWIVCDRILAVWESQEVYEVFR